MSESAVVPQELQELLRDLFPRGFDVRVQGGAVRGAGRAKAGEVAVLGTWAGAEVGVELALALAREVLHVVRETPYRPMLVLVDTRGQRMSRRDELLGLNGYLAHLAACVELARRRGHRVVALVRGEAVSGGVLGLGFMADEVHALPGARVAVMNLPAMSKVTRIPLERLEQLSARSPVLAPGLDPYLRIGAIESVWTAPLAAHLEAALARPTTPDRRSVRGDERGGRTLALRVARRVEEASIP